MSAEITTYVGIYIEIPHIKSERKETKYKNAITGNKQKTKFDPNSGQEGIPYIVTHNEWEEPNCYIIKEGYVEDMFFSPAYTATDDNRISTIIAHGSKYEMVSDGDLFNFNFGDINPSQIIEDFINDEEYRKYLEHYREEYGEIKIKFGVVNYAH